MIVLLYCLLWLFSLVCWTWVFKFCCRHGVRLRNTAKSHYVEGFLLSRPPLAAPILAPIWSRPWLLLSWIHWSLLFNLWGAAGTCPCPPAWNLFPCSAFEWCLFSPLLPISLSQLPSVTVKRSLLPPAPNPFARDDAGEKISSLFLQMSRLQNRTKQLTNQPDLQKHRGWQFMFPFSFIFQMWGHCCLSSLGPIKTALDLLHLEFIQSLGLPGLWIPGGLYYTPFPKSGVS